MISTFHPTKRLKALPKKATSSEYFLINSTTITIYSQQLTIATFIIHSNQNRTKMKRGIKWAQVFAGDFDCEQQETIGNRRITPKEKCQKLTIAHLLLQLFHYGCVAHNYIMPYYDLQAIHVFEQFLPLLLHIFFYSISSFACILFSNLLNESWPNYQIIIDYNFYQEVIINES